MFFKLDEEKNVVPASVEEFEEVILNQKVVKQEDIQGKRNGVYLVSTCFFGLDYSVGLRKPEFFETMIFAKGSRALDYQERYSTYEEALEGHQKAVEYVKKHLK